MVKRSCAFSRSPPAASRSSNARSSRLRSGSGSGGAIASRRQATATATRSVLVGTLHSDFSEEEATQRKRPRNSTSTMTSTSSTSAQPSTSRSSEPVNVGNTSSSRRSIETTRPSQQREYSEENPIQKSWKLFTQLKSTSQSMKNLMSENEPMFQEFKSFLISSLPSDSRSDCSECSRPKDFAPPPKEKNSVSTNTEEPLDQSNSARIEWSDDLMSSIKCTICQEICHQCVTVCPCFHTFCGGCLSTWFDRCSSQKTCPTCRKVILSVSKNVHADHFARCYLAEHATERRSEEELEELQRKDTLYCANVIMLPLSEQPPSGAPGGDATASVNNWYKS